MVRPLSATSTVGWGTAWFAAAYAAGKLGFFGAHAHLADAKAFAAFLAPLKRIRWFICSKRPFAGPQAVLAYLSRVAISNGRLIAASAGSVTFKVKDYRVEGLGHYTTMTRGRVHSSLPPAYPTQELPPPLRSPGWYGQSGGDRQGARHAYGLRNRTKHR
jgi:Putative transposase